jgi:hypothetical protein
VKSEAGDEKELYGGLIRLHLLYHTAPEPPIFGVGIISGQMSLDSSSA